MIFNFPGFAIGLALAQRSGLSQSASGSVGLVGGVVGNTPLGLALAVVLAQRLTPPPSPPAVRLLAAAPQMAAGAAPAAAQPLLAQMAAAAQQLGPAVMVPGAADLLPPPGNVRVNGQQIDNRFVIRVDWDHVPGARHYYVRRYHRVAPDHPWRGIPEEVKFVDGARFTEVILAEHTDRQHAERNLGFTVAGSRTPFHLGQESEPQTPGF